MITTIIIDGGAGRVLCSIPALERYVKEHGEEKVIILIPGWHDLLLSNTLLQPITFDLNAKGVFNNYIRVSNKVLRPEPYLLPDYFNQKINLCNAFDVLLNGNCSEIKKPKISIHNIEELNGKKFVNSCAAESKRKKTIVIQPFGSSAYYETSETSDSVLDQSSRSMNLLMYTSIIKYFSGSYNIILFSDPKFHFKEDIISHKLVGDLRYVSSVIKASDYFIGCDSSGQHIARALDKPGTIIFGSTFPENVSYPDWFNIIDKNKNKKVYSPIRLSDTDANLADRLNEQAMNYTQTEVYNVIKIIENHIKMSMVKQ